MFLDVNVDAPFWTKGPKGPKSSGWGDLAKSCQDADHQPMPSALGEGEVRGGGTWKRKEKEPKSLASAWREPPLLMFSRHPQMPDAI